MRPEDADKAYLWDMLDATKAVQQFVVGKAFNDYINDRMLRGAVERHVEIIGEAANRISQTFRGNHPEIPWRSIISQRHVLAHEYGEIKQELMWKVATVHIPEHIKYLEAIIPAPPEVEG